MKSLIAAIALVMTAAPALASDGFTTAFRDDMQIDFLSWCEGTKVMAQTQEGKPYERFNCADEGKVCKVYDAYQFGRVIYSAACDKK
ncbi:hypothetical protein AZI86_08925 [Bdellovibrio bacteriovorus]|uniref:Uncharacterized protein n=1 Tax=Bdellovibrio bacteriovorus TaxID=959 RepID=A0A150WRI2_BDEBC|nr:hypothetical protein [Bdellovibrio bacteriovorus]KYG67123.1 hypothetical protein AZI86_08925 [Bdellovibrio bacteriovorus]